MYYHRSNHGNFSFKRCCTEKLSIIHVTQALHKDVESMSSHWHTLQQWAVYVDSITCLDGHKILPSKNQNNLPVGNRHSIIASLYWTLSVVWDVLHNLMFQKLTLFPFSGNCPNNIAVSTTTISSWNALHLTHLKQWAISNIILI